MTQIIPVTDFLRNSGKYFDLIYKLDELILTRGGYHFATVRLTPEEKNRELFKLFGAWEGTELASNKFWEPVFKRKNRKKPIKF